MIKVLGDDVRHRELACLPDPRQVKDCFAYQNQQALDAVKLLGFELNLISSVLRLDLLGEVINDCILQRLR